MRPEIILASSSPVRREVLSRLKVVFTIHPSEFEERMVLEEGESFEGLAKRLALGKAEDVASRMQNAIVIGADSFAVFDGKIIGKPHNKEEAIKFLELLSGRTHEFYTGMAVIDTGTGREVVDCVYAKVHFINLTAKEINQHVAREEVSEAAGAYKIQGLGAVFAKKIDGDYYAIVGLSPSKLQEMLRSLDRSLFDYIPPLSTK